MIATDNDGEDPYVRGRMDFERSITRDQNPYDGDLYGTTFWEAWLEGWDDASAESSKMNHVPKE